MSGDQVAALAAARLVALLLERLLLEHLDEHESDIVDVDMGGMMAAFTVTMNDGSVVIVEVAPA